jgi:hypothetical protein
MSRSYTSSPPCTSIGMLCDCLKKIYIHTETTWNERTQKVTYLWNTLYNTSGDNVWAQCIHCQLYYLWSTFSTKQKTIQFLRIYYTRISEWYVKMNSGKTGIKNVSFFHSYTSWNMSLLWNSYTHFETEIIKKLEDESLLGYTVM